MALSKNSPRKMGRNGHKYDAPVYQSVVIYEGAFVNYNSTGYLALSSDTASEHFAGVATAKADNGSGASGAINCLIERGCLIFWAYTSSALTDNGLEVYATGDDTLATSASNVATCGTIALAEVGVGWWVEMIR